MKRNEIVLLLALCSCIRQWVRFYALNKNYLSNNKTIKIEFENHSTNHSEQFARFTLFTSSIQSKLAIIRATLLKRKIQRHVIQSNRLSALVATTESIPISQPIWGIARVTVAASYPPTTIFARWKNNEKRDVGGKKQKFKKKQKPTVAEKTKKLLRNKSQRKIFPGKSSAFNSISGCYRRERNRKNKQNVL